MKINSLSRLTLMLLLAMGQIGLLNAQTTAQSSTTEQTLSLKQAVTYGMENSNVTRENVRLLAEARERIREAVSIGYPQVSASVSYVDNLALPTFLIPDFADPTAPPVEAQFGSQHNASAKAEVSQLVFDGSYLIGVKATRQLYEIEEDLTVLNNIELEHSITQSYYQAITADLAVAAIERNLENLGSLLREVEATYESGFIEELEVDRLLMSKNNLDASLANMKTDRDLAYNLLKFNMGMPLKNQLSLSDSVQTLTPTQGESLIGSIDASRRIEMQILDQRMLVNESNIKYNRSFFLPKLYAFGSYEQAAQRDQFDFFSTGTAYPWFESAMIGAELQIPIFDGFAKRSRVEQAKLQLENIRLQRADLANGIELEVAGARNEFAKAARMLQAYQDNMALAEKIFNTATIKYREGVGSSLELTNAERDLYEAQDTYIGGLTAMLMADSELKKATGAYQLNK